MSLKWRNFVGQDYLVGNEPQNRFLPKDSAPVEIAQASAIEIASPNLIIPNHNLKNVSKFSASSCQNLDELKNQLANFEGISLKNTALNLVFAKGNPKSKIMFIGEAPGAEEDKIGLPFVGEAGQLLDKMLACIGLDLTNCYITNMLVWRPPGNRTPTTQEVALMLPFLHRHIELVNPAIIVTLGGVATSGLLEKETPITRARGIWQNLKLNEKNYALLPTFHPAYLLRSPLEKKKTWQDLQSIKEKISQI